MSSRLVGSSARRAPSCTLPRPPTSTTPGTASTASRAGWSMRLRTSDSRAVLE